MRAAELTSWLSPAEECLAQTYWLSLAEEVLRKLPESWVTGIPLDHWGGPHTERQSSTDRMSGFVT